MQGSGGLRERKRVETHQRIIDAALDLALTSGLEQVTVEAISAAAGVSPRTFFNYFESKDEALVGLPDERSDAEVVAQVLSTAADLTLREMATRLLTERLSRGLQDSRRRADRLELFNRYPNLFAAAFRRMTAAQATFADALRAVASERGVLPTADPVWADILIAATAAAARAVIREWTSTGRPGSVADIEKHINSLMTTTWEILT